MKTCFYYLPYASFENYSCVLLKLLHWAQNSCLGFTWFNFICMKTMSKKCSQNILKIFGVCLFSLTFSKNSKSNQNVASFHATCQDQSCTYDLWINHLWTCSYVPYVMWSPINLYWNNFQENFVIHNNERCIMLKLMKSL